MEKENPFTPEEQEIHRRHNIKYSPDVHDVSKDPMVLAKMERMIQSLKECPIPEWILNRTAKPE